MNEYFESISDSKMLVSNSQMLGFGNVSLILHQSEGIQEFLRKEIACSRKLDFNQTVRGGGHGLEKKDGLDWRAIFNSFFLYEDLKLVQEPLYKILDKNINQYAKIHNITNSEFKKIDLKELLGLVMVDWISLILFGYDSVEPLEVN